MTRIALVQLSVVDGDVDANLVRAERLLGAAPPADLYLLPELWSTGYGHTVWERAAAESTPEVVAWLRDVAAQRRATVGGSLISRDQGGRLVNRFWLVGPDGEAAWYDKGHLFSPLQEPAYLAAGRQRSRHRLDPWCAALSICFDLRFPEHYRRDALDGADLFLVVAAWPHPRSAVLNTLSRARAIENQAVLALCNRVGQGTPDLQYCGGSMVVLPGGEVIADAGSEECVVVAEVEPSCVHAVRENMPVLPLRAEGLDW
ncbi:MAG: carbon-nitrogen family hydrolase [Gemmatimonadetes bacterium]|nr:carbon-nitrogen family hydrolase [Gemmatimonadota bacterium]